ncbi:MAG: FAD-binding oxidoreductase [Solirubrobacteraceae bacterium]
MNPTRAALRPESFEQAAAALAAAAAEGRSVRIAGAGSKRHWGHATPEANLVLETGGLNAIVEHNAGDLTARLEAGVTLETAQRAFAAAGQMLALDPPPAPGEDAPAATIGGIVATGDCGPLRHRYGAPRDLVVGITVALSDGTIARAGGQVIKNVAGYDLARLFAGSFGTLGLILAVNFRLHPRPETTVTALGRAGDPGGIAHAARALAAAPLEPEALDVAWDQDGGCLLASFAGAAAAARAQRAVALMAAQGLDDVAGVDDDAELWERHGARQRSATDAVVRVAAPPSALAELIAAARACSATLVGRAALGHSWLTLAPAAVATLRERLPSGSQAVLLDRPEPLQDPWGAGDGPALELMRAVKARFDPTGTCNPGLFVGGI